MQQERLTVLRKHGVVVADQSGSEARPVGVMAPQSVPYLVNLAHDPFSRHCLVYYIHEVSGVHGWEVGVLMNTH